MAKTLKKYYCDCCGSECEHSEFILPKKGEDRIEWATDRFGTKLYPFHYPTTHTKQSDLCPTCQNTLARIVGLIRSANMYPDGTDLLSIPLSSFVNTKKNN